ncbi:hypothetical protein KSS87_006102 [Heliosperma pusillum]|nr:hypothetical protein KSS87_006102 [Heliosperma pusillum]
MMRTRLVWFTSGFLIAGASIASFIHRDLSKDRLLLLAQLEDNFGALQTRVSNLEFVPHNDSNVQINVWKKCDIACFTLRLDGEIWNKLNGIEKEGNVFLP